jgi:hypothetical protein
MGITLSFPVQEVFIMPAIPGIQPIPAITDPGTGEVLVPFTPGVLREPKTATVNATMIVTVRIDAGSRFVTSRAIYEYVDGRLSDDPDREWGFDNPPVPPLMDFEAGGYGKWELIRYEHIDFYN